MEEEIKEGMEANPLKWPNGWKRTQTPKRSAFNTSFTRARDNLYNELRLLGAKNVILNSNLELRQDGLPYVSQKNLEDPAIVVYFKLKGEDQCIPCDRWTSAKGNLQAICLTITALRGLERWGAKDMVNAAFKGFKALPNYYVQYFKDCYCLDSAHSMFQRLCRELHPDVGGNTEEFAEMNRQYQEELKKF